MPKALILAPAFGVGRDVPYLLRSNLVICEDASAQARALNAPVFTQLGMQMAEGIETTQVPGEDPTNWATTTWMAYEAVKYARAHGIREIWLAVALPHLERCHRDLRIAFQDLGCYHITIEVCPQIYKRCEYHWFCPESKQWRTQGRRNWLIWNFLVSMLPERLYLWLTDKRPEHLR